MTAQTQTNIKTVWRHQIASPHTGQKIPAKRNTEKKTEWSETLSI
jgi:hypothetical protein